MLHFRAILGAVIDGRIMLLHVLDMTAVISKLG